MKRAGILWMMLAVLPLGVAACGYNFAGAISPYPEELQIVAVGPIVNSTREVGLDRAIRDALEDEISLRGTFEIADDPNTADASLSGELRLYETRPVAFNSRDEVLQYQIMVVADLVFRDIETGKILWEGRGLRFTEDYGAVAGVVVTSSSRFAQSSPDAGDLAGITDVQVSESQRREATDRLVENVSRDVYNQMMDDF